MMHEYHDNDDDAMRPLIHRAAGRGDIDTASRVLDTSPESVDVRNEIQNQPLHEACWAKFPAMVALLIERGADVNALGDFGQSPLHFAVRDGGNSAFEIVSMLLRAGADPHLLDDRLKETPLGFAIREYKDELGPVIELMRELGVSA